jgi:hypothetical protein
MFRQFPDNHHQSLAGSGDWFQFSINALPVGVAADRIKSRFDLGPMQFTTAHADQLAVMVFLSAFLDVTVQPGIADQLLQFGSSPWLLCYLPNIGVRRKMTVFQIKNALT